MRAGVYPLNRGHSDMIRYNPVLTDHRTGFSKDDLPYIIHISGHSGSGKTTLYSELGMHLEALGSPATLVRNYKSARTIRPGELPGDDFLDAGDDQNFQKHINDGEIIKGYTDNNRSYGISREFSDALKRDVPNIPIMVTNAQGLLALMSYLRNEKIQNSLKSFMLHTSIQTAASRFYHRGSTDIGKEELENQFLTYRNHEDLFRHVLKNEQKGIEHIVNRSLEILDLETRLDQSRIEKAVDFREAYVEHVVKKLFGASTADLLNSLNQDIRLCIPDDIINRYSLEHETSRNNIKKIAAPGIIGAANYYGILTLYLEPNPNLNADQKNFLVDLIEETVGLTHQYKEPELHSFSVSRNSLKKMGPRDSNATDFYISFSPYDPIKTPRLESRIHTIAFERVSKRYLNILPVSDDQANKFIEGK